jgi:hypothetical protein
LKEKQTMKKLKFLLLCTALGALLTTTAFSGGLPASDVKTVINEFANSHVNSDAIKLSELLSSEVTLTTVRGTEVLTQGQAAIINLVRQSKGIKQNCSTVVEVLASSDAMVLAKVNFVYGDFVVENFLTLELDRKQNWKITRINKFFADPNTAKVLTKE